MSSKSLIMLGLLVGSSVGSYIPLLFGGEIFSFFSLISGTIGGIIGVYIAYKATEDV